MVLGKYEVDGRLFSSERVFVTMLFAVRRGTGWRWQEKRAGDVTGVAPSPGLETSISHFTQYVAALLAVGMISQPVVWTNVGVWTRGGVPGPEGVCSS